MKNYVIYDHISPNGKHYIGQTGNKVEYRWGKNGANYLRKQKNGQYAHPAFAPAILKYGGDAFEHKILFSGLSKQDADMIEIDLIYYYQKEGLSYNIVKGGEGGLKYYDCSTGYSRNREYRLSKVKEYRESHKEACKSRGKAGRDSHKEEMKAYREANKEARNAQSQQGRESHKEEVQEYNKRYHIQHREEAATKAKKYREANREVILQKKKEYRETHKEEIKAARRAHYAAHREEILAKKSEQRKLKKQSNESIDK